LSGSDVTVPRPAHGVGGENGGNLPGVELTFGLAEPIAAFDETERQAASPGSFGWRAGRTLADIFGMVALKFGGETFDLATIERSNAAADLQRVLSRGSSRPEPTGPLDRSGQWAVAATPVAQAELVRDIGELELNAPGGVIEGVSTQT